MSSLDLRCKALNNIPPKKIEEKLNSINTSNDDFSKKQLKSVAINRYAESNIPIEYWSLSMEKDFKGDSKLLKYYQDYVTNLKDNYLKGVSVCFAGNHGRGKSFAVTSILKKACQKGYDCQYNNLSDIVNVLIQASGEDKFIARRELCMVDFLVIDEFDSRFMQSENAAELYARTLESIFRTRAQNKLPTLMCTNSPNIIEAFDGPLKDSIQSLMTGYLKIFPVFGDDYRKKINA